MSPSPHDKFNSDAMFSRFERHVVLVSPEIHWNTGNIGRTCLGTGARLHLIKPLGFSLENRYVKRAGLDYWSHVDVSVWDDFNCFYRKLTPKTEEIFLLTKNGSRPFWHAPVLKLGEARGRPLWTLPRTGPIPTRCWAQTADLWAPRPQWRGGSERPDRGDEPDPVLPALALGPLIKFTFLARTGHWTQIVQERGV